MSPGVPDTTGAQEILVDWLTTDWRGKRWLFSLLDCVSLEKRDCSCSLSLNSPSPHLSLLPHSFTCSFTCVCQYSQHPKQCLRHRIDTQQVLIEFVNMFVDSLLHLSNTVYLLYTRHSSRSYICKAYLYSKKKNYKLKGVVIALLEGCTRGFVSREEGHLIRQEERCMESGESQWRLLWDANLRRITDLINAHKYILDWIKHILSFSNLGNFSTMVFKYGWHRLK